MSFYPREKGEYKEVSGVLKALEKAARMPNLHMVDLNEVFRWENWRAYRNINKDIYPFENELESQIVNADLTSRFMASAFEIDAMISMLNTLLDFAYGFQEQFKLSQERLVSKLSKGFGSLPDELVSKIFQFAVWEEREYGGKQAIWLSQVSRRYRVLSLETRSLWTTLHSRDSDGRLEMFISRAGPNEEFHVFLHSESFFNPYLFARKCHSTMSRWKTLTLTQEDQDWYSERLSYGGVENILESLLGFLGKNGMQFEMLEDLDICGDRSDYYGRLESGNLRWATSKLRTLRCSYFLPSPSDNFSSVTSFACTQSISSGYEKSPLKWIFAFLSAMPKLSFFDLEVYDATATYSGSNDLLVLPTCEKPSITSFHLRLRNFDLSKFEAESSCITKLVNVLRMPSLKDLSISIGVCARSYGNYYPFVNSGRSQEKSTKWSRALYNASHALLPDHFTDSAQLASLSYEVWLDGHGHTDSPPALNGRVFHIPLHRILDVSNMTVTSFVPVLFTQGFGDENLQPTGFGESSRLRELKFIGCENMTEEDIRWTVRSLRLIGVLKNIVRVIVKDCDKIVYDDIVGVVGEERLHFLD
ncbi:hypothetical protein SCHPADRAFT_944573 [Schizopora paradoxa]|uniref:F-box domain-containing protein n=1 Tax=Schizopora paradoxa TaxID=27342 RepID=A0A0H2R8X7_9AGAM|nr:hypothetical protein SCHPADRAFT_944573 [Schizopora paradoxa]